MKVLLVHIDGKMPNLALMKISAFHKTMGNKVSFKTQNPEKVYISCIFRKNRSKALGIKKMFACPVEIGGPGINLDSKLPENIEHIKPDYNLYNVNYSMGFSSRGCIRNCPWCIVPKKEGAIKDHAPIEEFYCITHEKLILLDNNFLASPKWFENLEKIRHWHIKVNFSQGLDIRLVDQENAKLLSKTSYYDWKFKKRRLHFAFDLPNLESQVLSGVQKLAKAGIRHKHLMFYILVGFNSTFEEDMHRFKLIDDLGAKPYIMLYNDRRDSPILRHFERWVNRRYYKVCDFKNYRPVKNLL